MWKGGEMLRETEVERQRGEEEKRGLLKTKDFIQTLLNLIQLMFMLLFFDVHASMEQSSTPDTGK